MINMNIFSHGWNLVKFRTEKIEVPWLVLFLYNKMSIKNSFVQCPIAFVCDLSSPVTCTLALLRKRPPKMQRLSVRLREVFITRIEPQGALPRRGPGTSTLCKIILILLHAMSKLGYVQFYVLTKGLCI